MITKKYIFPYDISDSVGLGAIWKEDILSITFFKYYTDKNTPNKIEIKFYGVEWIRSTTITKYPCNNKDWEIIGYSEDKNISDYLLIERDWFNNDYEEFMSGNGFGLNTIRGLDNNIVFIDDRIIFSCNKIEVVSAVCIKNIKSAEKHFLKEYKRKI